MINTKEIKEKEHKIINALYELSYQEQQNNADKNKDLWDDYFVLDENQSVKWNKERIEEHNKLVYDRYRESSNIIVEEREKLFNLLYGCLKEKYEDDKLTYRMFKLLWEYGCNDADDYSHYWNILDNLKYRLENFYELLELREEER